MRKYLLFPSLDISQTQEDISNSYSLIHYHIHMNIVDLLRETLIIKAKKTINLKVSTQYITA